MAWAPAARGSWAAAPRHSLPSAPRYRVGGAHGGSGPRPCGSVPTARPQGSLCEKAEASASDPNTSAVAAAQLLHEALEAMEGRIVERLGEQGQRTKELVEVRRAREEARGQRRCTDLSAGEGRVYVHPPGGVESEAALLSCCEQSRFSAPTPYPLAHPTSPWPKVESLLSITFHSLAPPQLDRSVLRPSPAPTCTRHDPPPRPRWRCCCPGLLSCCVRSWTQRTLWRRRHNGSRCAGERTCYPRQHYWQRSVSDFLDSLTPCTVSSPFIGNAAEVTQLAVASNQRA